MKTDNTDAVYSALSRLMDETVGEDSITEKLLGEFEILIDEKLLPVIGKIPYENKYELIDSISGLCRDISMYLYFPELINKVVIGFHNLDGVGYKFICSHLLENRLKPEKSSILYKKSILSETVPTIFYAGSDEQQIKCLNLAEKTVVLSDKGYLALLNDSKTKEIDLAGLSCIFSIPSREISDCQSYFFIPDKIDIYNDYYYSITNSIEILVIHAKECTKEVLKNYKNLSKLFVFGKFSSANLSIVKGYCEEANISIEYYISISEILKDLKSEQKTIHNFCYKYCLENILYEFLWYLSVKKRESQDPLTDINDNLLFNEDDESGCIKELQKRYSDKIDSIMNLYTEFRSVCKKLVEKVEQIQEYFGIRENATCVNGHINMEHIMLDLILKLSEVYKEFPESDSIGRMRNYCSVYKKNFGKNEIVDVILNDYLGEIQDKNNLEIFRKMQIDSIFFKRKKLDLRHSLSLTNEECAKVIFSLAVPLHSVEKRILGEYYLLQKKHQKAKAYLLEAVFMGDETAGKLIIDSMDITEQEMRQLADYGVKEAAYHIGNKLYPAMKDHVQFEESCLKYLHIAASKNHLDAIKLLGEISYDKYVDVSRNPEDAKKALHYYLIVAKNGQTYNKINEVIGSLYFDLENYRDAIIYCKKAKTAQANYLLGRIYELGLGCASDESKALEYYEKSIDAGHIEAQVAYEKLNAKIEERKKKTMVQENKSYSSYTSYSGYYTSYYSGW